MIISYCLRVKYYQLPTGKFPNLVTYGHITNWEEFAAYNLRVWIRQILERDKVPSLSCIRRGIEECNESLEEEWR